MAGVRITDLPTLTGDRLVYQLGTHAHFYERLAARMLEKGFSTTDPAYVAIVEARDAAKRASEAVCTARLEHG
jgi:hypothetical protein